MSVPGRRAPSVRVDTPDGPAAVDRFPAAGSPRATLLLGHGAGRGPDTDDLLALAGGLPERGVDVLLVTAPWVLAGRRVAAPPARLDLAWRAVVGTAGDRGWVRGPLVAGGRSAGARVAARTAGDTGAAALLLLAFPLHPPGRPAAGRAPELVAAAAGCPVVVLQGDRDAFGTPAELRAALAEASTSHDVSVVPLLGADHSLRHRPAAPLTAGEWRAAVVAAGWRAVRAARRR